MSEDALVDYIDARSQHGDGAPLPSDPEARQLTGTVKLTASALGAPAPSEEAERQSRERLVSQLTENSSLPVKTEGGGFFARLLRRLRGGS